MSRMPKHQEPETAGNIACEVRKQGVMRVCVQLQFSVSYDPELKGTAHFHVGIHTSSNLIHFFFFLAESHYAPLGFAMQTKMASNS